MVFTSAPKIVKEVFKMNFLRRFMYGRYGVDQLSMALLIIGVLFSFVSSATNIYFFRLLFMALIVISYFRIFSRNTYKRAAENMKFLSFWNPIKANTWLPLKKQFNTFIKAMKDKDHKYFTCPSCRQTLRVPKGQGKITVTCPKCKNQFSQKS